MGERGLIAIACGVAIPLLVLLPLNELQQNNHSHDDWLSDTILVVS